MPCYSYERGETCGMLLYRLAKACDASRSTAVFHEMVTRKRKKSGTRVRISEEFAESWDHWSLLPRNPGLISLLS